LQNKKLQNLNLNFDRFFFYCIKDIEVSFGIK